MVCIQEIKAKEEQLTDDVFYPKGYHCYYNEAERPGYAGTAIFASKSRRRSLLALIGTSLIQRVATYR